MWNLLYLSACFALVTAAVVRMNLKDVDIGQSTVAAVRAAIVFVLGLGLQMLLVPHVGRAHPGDPYGKSEFGLWMMISLYTLLLAYMAFYIALFNDLLGKRSNA